jgi:branched-chain amino acid transport system substrate-binding protein
MAQPWQTESLASVLWWNGKTTRRRFLGLSATAAGALGATILVPAPWREAFGQTKTYKIGAIQSLTGVAAPAGKIAVVGTQIAGARINRAGGINRRPVELVIADDESKPDVARRKAENLLVEDNIDVHQGGLLSNICLACLSVFEERKVVNMIGGCPDLRLTTSKCSRYTFRSFDYSPSQAIAFAPHLVGKIGRRWHIVHMDYPWGGFDGRHLRRSHQGSRR